MADDLGDLGEIVTDRTLVLNLIRGLGERFSNIGLHLRRSHPFPSFLEAKDALLLEEPTLAHQSSTPTAFIASQSPSPAPATAGGGASAGGGGASHGGAPSSSKGRCGKRVSKKGGSGQPGAGGKAPQTASGAPWPTYWNPWTGTIQMWPGPRPSLVPIPQPHPLSRRSSRRTSSTRRTSMRCWPTRRPSRRPSRCSRSPWRPFPQLSGHRRPLGPTTRLLVFPLGTSNPSPRRSAL